ncbi:MAG: glutamate--cysteine ligase, partial [Xanthomonadales bacterium]|nr:glutamate--cysteine ligase [Xanthomonadales bacterium]
MRGADSGPWNRICALPALWVGLLYDQTSLDAAWDLCKDWTLEERHQLRDSVPRLGLRTTLRGESLRAIAERVLAIAAEGLRRRARLNSNGVDERIYLQPLLEFADAGISPADRKLALYHGAWGGSIDRVFRDFAY